MNRITTTIQRLRRNREKAFIPFITAGYPDIQSTKDIFIALEEAGADIIELGMPFSDPLADGPTIQLSSHSAIRDGVTPQAVFDCIREIRRLSDVPILLFAYTNLILNFGIRPFMRQLKETGGDGLLVPDLPVEESQEIRKYAKTHNISMIFLITPLTGIERMKKIERFSDDFVYCVSITGVTGARSDLFDQIKPYLQTVRQTLKKPFMVGFGVSSGDEAGRIAAFSDGIIVGSALIKQMQQHPDKNIMIDKIRIFAEEIHNGIQI